MLVLICLILITLIVVLQIKINKASESLENKDVSDADNETVSVERTACPAPEIKVVKNESAFQRIFLGNIFNKIGAIAIIVALIFFIKLVSAMIVITPLTKMILAYVCGLGMVGTALHLHRKDKMKNYSEVLLGTGFAVLFITTFCGYSVFKILTPLYTILTGSLILFATYYIADRMKTYSMIAIGLIGGYLTPFLSGVEASVSLAFLVFLNMISLVYTLRNKKIRFLNIVNLVLTVFIMLGYGIAGTRDVVYPIALWAVYILYDILRDKSSAVDNAVCWINYFVLTVFTLWYSYGNMSMLGILFGVSAIGYFMLSMLSRFQSTNLFRHYDYCVLINLWLYILIIASDMFSVLAWTLIGFLMSYLVTCHKYEYLKPAMWFYYASMFFGALILNLNGEWCLFADYQPVWNYRTLCFGIPVISMFGSAFIMRKDYPVCSNFLKFGAFSILYIYLIGEINSLISYLSDLHIVTGSMAFARLMSVIILGFMYSVHSKYMYVKTNFDLFNVLGIVSAVLSAFILICSSYYYPAGYTLILNLRFAAYVLGILTFIRYAKLSGAAVYKYIAVILGFMLFHSESAGVKHLFGDDFQYVISLCWVLYSGAVTVVGILRNINYLKIMGIILSILTVLRIIFVDLPSVEAIYKLIICLALGVVFMFISYIYTSKTKQ